MLVFCALSIAYKAVEDQNVGNGFGKRWYSIVIFAYDFLVRYSLFISLVYGLCFHLMCLPL